MIITNNQMVLDAAKKNNIDCLDLIKHKKSKLFRIVWIIFSKFRLNTNFLCNFPDKKTTDGTIIVI